MPRTDSRNLSFLRTLAPRLRPHRALLIWASVLIVLSSAVSLVFPLVVRQLLDAAFLAGERTTLDRVALGLLALFAFQGLLNFVQSYQTAAASERVIAELRIDLFRALVHQTAGFFTTQRVGELSSRLASDATLVQQVLRFGIPELVRQGLFLIGAVVLIAATSPRLTGVTLIAIPVAILIGWFFGRRVRAMSTRIQDTLADAVARAEQVFTQIRVVQAFTREAWEIDQFTHAVERSRDQGLRRGLDRAGLTGSVTFAAFGAIVVVLWQGGRLVLAGQLTPGTLVAFLLYAVTIAGAITSLAGFWSNLQEASGAVRRIFELLELPRTLADPEHPRRLPEPCRGMVQLHGVRFRYADDQPWVLRGIDLALEPGETVALVGASGAGKSTLAALLPRFWDPVEGAVTLDGIDVREVVLHDLRSRIGLVPQEPMLFAGTVADNLRYGRPQATAAELEEAARAAHAHEFIAAFPDGYEQVVGERGVTLSAGQRQRLAIARVMLERPSVLILDEASSALDAESERLVQEALDRLVQGRTTLVIAHRLSTVLAADRIVVLADGEIEAAGSHADLLVRSPTYARLYQNQLAES